MTPLVEDGDLLAQEEGRGSHGYIRDDDVGAAILSGKAKHWNVPPSIVARGMCWPHLDHRALGA